MNKQPRPKPKMKDKEKQKTKMSQHKQAELQKVKVDHVQLVNTQKKEHVRLENYFLGNTLPYSLKLYIHIYYVDRT